MPDTIELAAETERVPLQLAIMREIRRHLTPYLVSGMPITGETVICDGTTVNSLTLVDMVMELEERFDVLIPMKLVAEIRTVAHLADTVVFLHARR